MHRPASAARSRLTIAHTLAVVVAAWLPLAPSPFSRVTAQVVISPPVITLVEPERLGSFTVENRSTVAQEVTVEFRFGYPASDSAGDLRMIYDDSATAARSSIVPWVRAFPRRVLLGPGQRQLVRLTIRPPEGLPDGVYWARLVTSSVPESAPVDSAPRGITTQIAIRLQQITTVLYRRGEARTGIEVGTIAVHEDSADLHLLVPLRRTGVAPFLGSVRLRVRDSGGAVIHDATETTSVYFTLVKRFAVPRSRLVPRTYSVEISAVAERPDVSPDALFSMATAVLRTQFTVK